MKPASKDPQAFVIENDRAKPFAQTTARRKSLEIEFAPEPEEQLPVTVPHTSSSSSGFGWLSLLFGALLSLSLMGIGLWLTNLVQSYFVHSTILGWVAVALTALATIAALALISREIWGLWSLKHIEKLQGAASRAVNMNDATAGREALAGFRELFAGHPEMSQTFSQFSREKSEFMDAKDTMQLADRILLQPLDTKVQQIITRQAKRVTLLTTVTPAAGLDMLFVLALNLSMLRQISSLYGGRPSSLSTLKLARMILSHLAVAGGLALSDTLIQQLIGRGLLGRLSARFGEGAINGILTVRVGLAAQAVCRPIPTDSTTRESFASILKSIVSSKEGNTPDAAS